MDSLGERCVPAVPERPSRADVIRRILRKTCTNSGADGVSPSRCNIVRFRPYGNGSHWRAAYRHIRTVDTKDRTGVRLTVINSRLIPWRISSCAEGGQEDLRGRSSCQSSAPFDARLESCVCRVGDCLCIADHKCIIASSDVECTVCTGSIAPANEVLV